MTNETSQTSDLQNKMEEFTKQEKNIEKQIRNTRLILVELEQERDQLVKEKEEFCLNTCGHDFEYHREDGPYGSRFRVCKICNSMCY